MDDYKDIVDLLRNCENKNEGLVRPIEEEAADIIVYLRRKCMRMKSRIDRLEGFREGFAEIIKALPSTEPKKGKWLMTPTAWVYCSECNREPPNESNVKSDYCPNCGAKMEGEE